MLCASSLRRGGIYGLWRSVRPATFRMEREGDVDVRPSPFAAKLRQSADAIVRWLWFTPSTRLRARTLRRKDSAASPSGFVWSANFNAWLPGNGDAPSASTESSSCNRGQRGQRSQRVANLLQPSRPSNSANLSALLASPPCRSKATPRKPF